MKTTILTLILSASAALGQATISSATLSSATIGGTAPGGGSPSDTFSDTFADADSTDLGSHVTTTGSYAWSRPGGTGGLIEILNNFATNNTAPGQGARYIVSGHQMTIADYTATLSVSGASPTGEVSLGIRDNGNASGSRSAYFVVIFPTTGVNEVRLYSVVSGSTASLGTSGSSVGVTSIGIKASGTTITGYTSGVQFAQVTDSNISAAGYVGIGPDYRGANDSFGWAMDNLNVTAP